MTTTPEAARRIHEGRGVIGLDDPEEGFVAGWPEMAYESIRAINHLTSGNAIPAPLVYDVLGNLKGVGYLMPQALVQLAAGLERSLAEFDVYDQGSDDPTASVQRAVQYLADASEAARALGAALEAAQSAIALQGYNETGSR